MNKNLEEFKEGLNHTPAVFYLPNSVIILNRNSKKGYTEVSKEDLVLSNEGNFYEQFYNKFLLKQELKLRKIDYYHISDHEEESFRKQLGSFANIGKENVK